MIDERTLERLSRFLDEDLSPEETRAVQALLAADPEVSSEFEAMVQMKEAVSRSAAAMEPPAELDALLEPLRRAAPGPRRIRPSMQWMAAAAVVVIGVTVGLEVAKRRPMHEILQEDQVKTTIPRPSTASREGYFQLQPLPTASPEDAELLGAVDHLMAAPQPEPEVEEPALLEIIGPLRQESTVGKAVAKGEFADEDAGERKRVKEIRPPDESADTSESARSVRRQSAPTPEISSSSRDGAVSAASPSLRAPVDASLLLDFRGLEVAVPCSVTPETPQGLWRLTVVVVSGRITGCREEAEERDAAGSPCDTVRGLAVDSVENGEYRAKLMIPDPHPR